MSKFDYSLYHVRGEGGNADLSEEDLKELKEEVESIQYDGTHYILEKKELNYNIRFCVWDGQSDSGLKHKENLGHDAWPFEGASDVRLRLADMLINETSLLLVMAATRAYMGVRGIKMRDKGRAKFATDVMKWVLNDQIGHDLWVELMRLVQFQEGNSPGLGVLKVFYEEETAMRNERVRLDDFVQSVIIQAGEREMSEDEVLEVRRFVDWVTKGEEEDQAVLFLERFFPYISKRGRKEIVRDLRETGEASFPYLYMKKMYPRIKALQMYDDVFIPRNSVGMSRARIVLERRWLSEAELFSKKRTEGYSDEFVKDVLQHQGETAFFDEEYILGSGIDSLVSFWDVYTDKHKDYFEVIDAYWKASNDEGYVGVYRSTFSYFSDIPARKEKELYDAAHGEYPFFAFPREILTGRLLDSRGIPETAMTEQNSLKYLDDSFCDHTSFATLPPILVPDRLGSMSETIAPLVEVRNDPRNPYSTLKVGEYPAANESYRQTVMRRIDEYFGRDNPEVSPVLTNLKRQGKVQQFLGVLKDAYKMIFQLVMEKMPIEDLAEITGSEEPWIERTVREIQGQFDFSLYFDARDLDQEYLIRLAEVISTYLSGMDKNSKIMYDRVVDRLLRGLDPLFAEDVLKDSDGIEDDELEDEKRDLAVIAATGLEPKKVEKGKNFEVRMAMYEDLFTRRPDFAEDWPEDRRLALQRHVKHLQFMVQQSVNRLTGKMGVQPNPSVSGVVDGGNGRRGREEVVGVG